MSIDEIPNIYRCPDSVVGNIFNYSGELSKLCKVSRYFRSIAEAQAQVIYEGLKSAYGPLAVQYAISALKMEDKSLPSKIDALFSAAKRHPPSMDGHQRKTSCFQNMGPYDTSRLIEYMQPFAEAGSLDAIWTAIYLSAGADLQEKMAAQIFSDHPLTRLQEIKNFISVCEEELQCVEVLNLQNKELRVIPKEVGLLKNLKILNLCGNHLSALPLEICRLKKLEVLDLSNNRLVFLSSEIGGMDSLKSLSLANNRIKCLSEEIGNLSGLAQLDLNGNLLCRLPDEMGKLTSLRHLCLSNNLLESLPETIGSLRLLQALHLYNNLLSTLPSTIGGLASLQVLSAPLNRLAALPDQTGALGALNVIVLDHNFLHSLPEGIAKLPRLRELHLHNNFISNLPDCPSLEILGIGDNFIFPLTLGESALDGSHSHFMGVYDLLGNDKWKEHIDGVYHPHGERVFDEGRHHGAAEPGYSASMNKAYQFLRDHFHRKLDVPFYLELHRIACGHFRGASTQTAIGEDEIGMFRGDAVIAHFPSPEYAFSQEAIAEFHAVNARLASLLGSSFSLGSIATTSESPLIWSILYHPLTRAQVEIVFNLFVSDFETEMIRALTPGEKLRAIAKLIQHLEWLHPPKDGCGRTDTALMNFLLSKHGLNPVLLEYPYRSSCRGLEEWVHYLKIGMQDWWKGTLHITDSDGEFMEILKAIALFEQMEDLPASSVQSKASIDDPLLSHPELEELLGFFQESDADDLPNTSQAGIAQLPS